MNKPTEYVVDGVRGAFVHAENCHLAGELAYPETAEDGRDWPDFLFVGLDAAKAWSTADDSFRRNAGKNVMEFYGEK